MLSEQALVGDADFAVSGESAELPYEDGVEGMVLVRGVSDHLLERRSLLDLSAFGVVLVGYDDFATVGFDPTGSGGYLGTR